MIPREILKKIRQIELRTNRLGSGSAVSVCPGGMNQSVFSLALTCVLSPGRGFPPIALSVDSQGHPANPVAGYFRDAAGASPSPWGEGWDEGDRGTSFFSAKDPGTVRCAVHRHVQRRNDSDRVFASHLFRPLLRERGHRSAMSLPCRALRFNLRPQPPSVYSAFRARRSALI